MRSAGVPRLVMEFGGTPPLLLSFRLLEDAFRPRQHIAPHRPILTSRLQTDPFIPPLLSMSDTLGLGDRDTPLVPFKLVRSGLLTRHSARVRAVFLPSLQVRIGDSRFSVKQPSGEISTCSPSADVAYPLGVGSGRRRLFFPFSTAQASPVKVFSRLPPEIFDCLSLRSPPIFSPLDRDGMVIHSTLSEIKRLCFYSLFFTFFGNVSSAFPPPPSSASLRLDQDWFLQ